MFKLFFKIILGFSLIALGVALASRFSNFELGNDNFWDHHGVWFLIFIALFPRLTLLLSSVASGGFIWWLAWLITPRILVAFLATLAYWNQNPALVLISWFVALGGESSEKTVMVRRGSFTRKTSREQRIDESEIFETTAKKVD